MLRLGQGVSGETLEHSVNSHSDEQIWTVAVDEAERDLIVWFTLFILQVNVDIIYCLHNVLNVETVLLWMRMIKSKALTTKPQ